MNKIIVIIDEDHDTVTFEHADGKKIEMTEDPDNFLRSIPHSTEIEMHFCRQNKVFQMRRPVLQ